MDLHRLDQDAPHREARIQARVGVLENELDAPPEGHHLALRESEQLRAVEHHLAAARLDEVHQQHAERGFAGARFTDHAERAAARQPERDVAHGVDRLAGE